MNYFDISISMKSFCNFLFRDFFLKTTCDKKEKRDDLKFMCNQKKMVQ